MDIVEKFEAARPRLTSIAHRILGSLHDAEDAVQIAWIRVQSAPPGHGLADADNPDGWLTTLVARICLDQLRLHARRNEAPLSADLIPAAQLEADEQFLRREEVSRAMLVVLHTLSPKQRVAYVLHDLFAVPFADIAAVLGTTEPAAKKLASRARGRLDESRGNPRSQGGDEDYRIVEAFLAAAAGGDIARLVTLLAPDAVRTADVSLLRSAAAPVLRGARAIAEETRLFADRIAVTTVLLVGGRPVGVIAPGGHPLALVIMEIRGGLISHVAITRHM